MAQLIQVMIKLSMIWTNYQSKGNIHNKCLKKRQPQLKKLILKALPANEVTSPDKAEKGNHKSHRWWHFFSTALTIGSDVSQCAEITRIALGFSGIIFDHPLKKVVAGISSKASIGEPCERKYVSIPCFDLSPLPSSDPKPLNADLFLSIPTCMIDGYPQK